MVMLESMSLTSRWRRSLELWITPSCCSPGSASGSCSASSGRWLGLRHSDPGPRRRAPVAAVASPLPAMLPAALIGVRRAIRNGALDTRLARLAITGGLPGTIIGALASSLVGGQGLLILSGLMLVAVGARVVMPDPVDHAARCWPGEPKLDRALGIVRRRPAHRIARQRRRVLVGAVVRRRVRPHEQASGRHEHARSRRAHGAHIDHPLRARTRRLACRGPLRLGMLPGSLAGAQLGQHISAERVRRAFGVVLLLFAGWFLVHQGL